MIPREEVEFTLKVAEAGARREFPAKVVEELCRVYLAWLDGPRVQITECNQIPGARDFDYGDMTHASQQFKAGAYVKLVEVPDVGG